MEIKCGSDYIQSVLYLHCINNSDAAGSVLNRESEPKCQKPNRLFFNNRPIFSFHFFFSSFFGHNIIFYIYFVFDSVIKLSLLFLVCLQERVCAYYYVV